MCVWESGFQFDFRLCVLNEITCRETQIHTRTSVYLDTHTSSNGFGGNANEHIGAHLYVLPSVIIIYARLRGNGGYRSTALLHSLKYV